MSSKNSIFDYNSDDIRSGSVAAPEQQHRERSKYGRLIYILVIAGISVLLSVFLISNIVKRVNSGLIMEIQVGDISVVNLEDGQYTGSYSSADMGASVTLDVVSGYIMDISLNSFTGIDVSRAETVFAGVISAQSLDTGDEDIGSTATDKILLKAIENAINGEGAQ